MRSRGLLVRIVAPILFISLSASMADAQMDTHRAVERYNRVSRGSNVAEWHKRLFDPDVKKRLEAVESLAKDGSEAAVKPLLDATADADPRVRAKAIDALGTIGSPRATQVLAQQLVLSHTDRLSKQRVLMALGRIRDPAGVPPILAFLANTQDSDLRCGALYALGEIGDARALDAVESHAASTEDAHAQRVAAEAETKIKARLAALPNQQPSILELERLYAPRDR
jgi:HEAT repeat protein